MNDRRDAPDPCTQEAREQGCTCRMSSVNSASIDPPHEIIDPWCPLHGGLDPDEEYEKKRERAWDKDWKDWPDEDY